MSIRSSEREVSESSAFSNACDRFTFLELLGATDELALASGGEDSLEVETSRSGQPVCDQVNRFQVVTSRPCRLPTPQLLVTCRTFMRCLELQ